MNTYRFTLYDVDCAYCSDKKEYRISIENGMTIAPDSIIEVVNQIKNSENPMTMEQIADLFATTFACKVSTSGEYSFIEGESPLVTDNNRSITSVNAIVGLKIEAHTEIDKSV